MDTKTALGAAGGITLTVAGAVTALALTLGGGTSLLGGADTAPPTSPVVEVVDQHGNPVGLQAPTAAPEIVVSTNAPNADLDMVAAPDGEPVEGAYASEAEYEEAEEYSEAEYEEAEEDSEAEYEDDDEYGEGDDD